VTDLNDRGRAEEAKAALSEEIRFKAEARRNKRVGLWFAEEILELPGDQTENFAIQTMDADFQESGYEDVIRFLKEKAETANKYFDEAKIRQKMLDEFETAMLEFRAQ
jgi:hypothetical protein